tara:strand:- start:140 stop:778 length:639 start_codon:yes stop_codon:yes gene_type:complete
LKYFPAKTPNAINVYEGDLPKGLKFSDGCAIDTETQGLRPIRDRLCVAQISAGDGVCYVVQFAPGKYEAPNLCNILSDPSIVKIFHYARFDVAILKHYLDADINSIFCTKIASKLVRTYTDKHGLKDLAKELLDIDISKEQQSSDWASEKLTRDQIQYAINDVLNLHAIRERLDIMLKRENRRHLAQRCFEFISTRAELDLRGWAETDIFSH